MNSSLYENNCRLLLDRYTDCLLPGPLFFDEQEQSVACSYFKKNNIMSNLFY